MGWHQLLRSNCYSSPKKKLKANEGFLNVHDAILELVIAGKKMADEAALFWGKDYINTLLLQAVEEEPGSVTTDILLRKDMDSFTFKSGWAFPRRIYFNGENCEMPLPQDFPALPSVSPRYHGCLALVLLLCLSVTVFLA